MAENQYYGTGRRKSSTARVFLRAGTGNIQINKRSIETYFGRETARMVVRQPLELVEMEEKFCSVALDIIGLSVFNYNFGSVTAESPVIKAVYSALVESEHRLMTPAPYWDLPLANQLVPRLRKFNGDLKLLNDVLDDLINRAKSTRSVADIEELEQRNYAEVEDPSLLRFLVDMRGAG